MGIADAGIPAPTKPSRLVSSVVSSGVSSEPLITSSMELAQAHRLPKSSERIYKASSYGSYSNFLSNPSLSITQSSHPQSSHLRTSALLLLLFGASRRESRLTFY